MYCSSCSKMVGYDEATFEVEDLEVEVDSVQRSADDKPDHEGMHESDADSPTSVIRGRVTGSVRMALPCAECGTDLKEAQFDLDDEFEMTVDGTVEDDVDLEVENAEPEERESGGGRFKKNMRGFDMDVTVSYGAVSETISFGDELAAGQFDEC